jgi:hypothetical protein
MNPPFPPSFALLHIRRRAGLLHIRCRAGLLQYGCREQRRARRRFLRSRAVAATKAIKAARGDTPTMMRLQIGRTCHSQHCVGFPGGDSPTRGCVTHGCAPLDVVVCACACPPRHRGRIHGCCSCRCDLCGNRRQRQRRRAGYEPVGTPLTSAVQAAASTARVSLSNCGSTRVCPTMGMKFRSPPQRGTTCWCR